jgi:predicted PurR-regulated permease PerM
VVIVMLAAFLVLAGVAVLLSTQFFALGKDLPELTGKLNERIQSLSRWLQTTAGMDESELVKTVEQSASSIVKSGGSFVSGLIGSASQLLTMLSLIPIMVFLILVGRKQFRAVLYAMVDSTHHEDLGIITSNVREVLRSYVSGVATVMLIVAVLNSLGLWLLGIPYAIFFGTLAALLTIIPYIGLIIGAILPVIMALITKDPGHWYALGVVGVFGTVQFLEGNFLTPRIVGGKVSVNPLAAIIALMVGGVVWGTVGLIVALPLTAILKVIADEIEALKPLALLLGTGDEEGKPGEVKVRRKKKGKKAAGNSK